MRHYAGNSVATTVTASLHLGSTFASAAVKYLQLAFAQIHQSTAEKSEMIIMLEEIQDLLGAVYEKHVTICKEAAVYHLQVIFLAAKHTCAYRSHVE